MIKIDRQIYRQTDRKTIGRHTQSERQRELVNKTGRQIDRQTHRETASQLDGKFLKKYKIITRKADLQKTMHFQNCNVPIKIILVSFSEQTVCSTYTNSTEHNTNVL